MAFTLQNWVRISTSANEPITTLQDASVIGGPRLYSYVSADTQGTIDNSGYFNAGVANNGVARELVTGDMIMVVSTTDGTTVFYSVTNTDGVITIAAFSGATPIGTADITNAAVTTLKIADANVTLAKLAAGITPSHVIKFGGQATTATGVSGSTHVLAIAGAVAATDRAFVQIVDNGTANVSAIQAVVTTDTLTVTFSGAPGADVTYNYQLIRAAS